VTSSDRPAGDRRDQVAVPDQRGYRASSRPKEISAYNIRNLTAWNMRLFQEPGITETQLESDLGRSLLGIYYALSADAPPSSFVKRLEHSRDTHFHQVFPVPEKLPPWLSSDDLDYYVEEFERSGYRGFNNWYRNIPTNNQITPELKGKKISDSSRSSRVPATGCKWRSLLRRSP
jgi:hypothetical protein